MWETVSHIQEACSQWNLQKVFLYESARTKKNISVLMCSVSFLNLKKLCLKWRRDEAERSDHVTWTQTNSYRESPRYSFAYSQCVLWPPADFSLSSPHQPAKTCSLRFFFFFYSFSLSPLSFCLSSSFSRTPIKANWHSGQTDVRGSFFGFPWLRSRHDVTLRLLVCTELLFLGLSPPCWHTMVRACVLMLMPACCLPLSTSCRCS